MDAHEFWTTIGFPFINFMMFLGLLIYWTRNPAKRAARDQHEKYQALIRESHAAKEAAEKAFAAISNRASGFSAEINVIKRDRLRQAEIDAQTIIESATTLAAHMKIEAQRLIEFEIARAKTQLRDELVAKALAVTVERLQNKLDAPQHHAIIAKSIGHIELLKAEVNK